MSDIGPRLDQVRELLQNKDFLAGKGLSNEVNIRIFCYHPEDEMEVRHFSNKISSETKVACKIKECNLYRLFLKICEDKRILNRIPEMEEKKGKAFLLTQLEKGILVELYVDKICKDRFEDDEVLFLTGVGDVFTFMRIHKLLEALQPKMGATPILVMYPGTFDGRYVKLFERLTANPYYRAFNVV